MLGQLCHETWYSQPGLQPLLGKQKAGPVSTPCSGLGLYH